MSRKKNRSQEPAKQQASDDMDQLLSHAVSTAKQHTDEQPKQSRKSSQKSAPRQGKDSRDRISQSEKPGSQFKEKPFERQGKGRGPVNGKPESFVPKEKSTEKFASTRDRPKDIPTKQPVEVSKTTVPSPSEQRAPRFSQSGGQVFEGRKSRGRGQGSRFSERPGRSRVYSAEAVSEVKVGTHVVVVIVVVVVVVVNGINAKMRFLAQTKGRRERERKRKGKGNWK